MTNLRQPHIAPDLSSRRPKAEKILHLLELSPRDVPWRVLEVGTGSGGIAHFLGTHPLTRCEVTSVDVVDLRMVQDGYAWHRVEGTALPFADKSFDVVITNHVIEHVGERADQLHHLCECHRVLAPSGRGYLAVPNRWGVMEPHFKLPFLSWLPSAWRSPYVRAMQKGEVYDCELLTQPAVESLFAEAGLQACNMGVEALRAMLAIEGTRGLARKCAAAVPDEMWRGLSFLFPTLVYRFSR
jgi:ubiquinone/menaquinone biosynthesis C-methylase UbiE